MIEKTYKITSKNTTLEPYWREIKDGTHPEIEYTDEQTYRKLGLEVALDVLKELIDAPDADLTLAQVKEDFSRSNATMSDGVAQKIVDYYNGRREIYLKLKTILKSGELVHEKVEIPEELNGFTTQEVDEDFSKSHTLEAWIEIEAE